MASRHAAARPRRAGENFARTHHHDEPDSKRVKFDVRNPSTLAPDAREDDAVLEADVIGSSGATKRGAVNLDGYDSDSDNENIRTRADNRRGGQVDLAEQLDKYDASVSDGHVKEAAAEAGDEDEDEDMFAPGHGHDGDDDNDDKGMQAAGAGGSGKDGKKAVRFLDESQIEGQEDASRSGGRIRLDEQESSDDEEDVELAIQEEGIDAEVGAGGLKRNAPKVEAFNLKAEMEEGRFDADGNYVRKAGDPDAVHDSWLEGVSKKEVRKAAEAHEKREAEARRQRISEDGVLVSDLLRTLIQQLQKAETPLEALARLGKRRVKRKQMPKWKKNRIRKKDDGMEVETTEEGEGDEQAMIKEAIDSITGAADQLLSRDYEDVYEEERERLVRAYVRETGQEWVEPEPREEMPAEAGERGAQGGVEWEFRWTDGRGDGEKQGPYDEPTMRAWQEAGYFGQGVEFRRAGAGEVWRPTASFS